MKLVKSLTLLFGVLLGGGVRTAILLRHVVATLWEVWEEDMFVYSNWGAAREYRLCHYVFPKIIFEHLKI